MTDEYRPDDEHEQGPPQGATTGRWEIISNAGKKPRDRRWRRWSDVPLWYRTLDRFGLPTLMVLILLYGGWRISIKALDMWRDTQNRTVAVIERLTTQVEKLTEQVQQNTTEDRVRRAVDRERQGRGGGDR